MTYWVEIPREDRRATQSQMPKQLNEDGWLTAAAQKRRVLESPLLNFINRRIRIPFSLSAKRDRFFIKSVRSLPPASKIVDLGCGSGRPYFVQNGNEVVGVDLCEPLLEQARTLYSRCVFQDIFEFLQEDDGVYDCIVSSDVIGHIPFELHPKLYQEIARHLRPGGLTAHFIEVEHHSFWSDVALSLSPELFQQEFVNRVGHIALRPIGEHLEHLNSAGMKLVDLQVMASHVVECGMIHSMFWPAYARVAPAWLRLVSRLDHMLSRNMFVKEAINVVLNPLEFLNTALQRQENTTAMMLCAEKA